MKTRYVRVKMDFILVLDESVQDVRDVMDVKRLKEAIFVAAYALVMNGVGVKSMRRGNGTISLHRPKKRRSG